MSAATENFDYRSRPSCAAPMPGFPLVQVVCHPLSLKPGYVQVSVSGWPADIAAAGILPIRGMRVGAGKKYRIDAHGNRWRAVSSWRLMNKGRRARFWRIDCDVPIALIARIPGAREGMEAFERHRAWEACRDDAIKAAHVRFDRFVDGLIAAGAKPSDTLAQAMARTKRPKLALVVDNTREGHQ